MKTEIANHTEIAREKKYSAPALKNQLSPEVKFKFDEFKNCMQQKRYGDYTVKTYIHQLEIFFGFYARKKKGLSFATARKTGNLDAGLYQTKQTSDMVD